jgi:hypothetical protein
VFKLTGEHVTDYSNASRTLLFDIRERRWDEELCDLLGVPPAALPTPRTNAEVYGHTSEFGGRVPVCGMAADQQAALYGQACHEPGTGKNTYGTGNFLLQNAGSGSPLLEQGLIITVAWGIGDRVDYALESSMFVTGAGVQWLRDGLGIIETAAETEELARGLQGNDGVFFVPALTGLGSPHWDPYTRGTIVGLTRGSGRAHLARATLEAIAYQTVDAVRAQNTALGIPFRELRARRRGDRQRLAHAVPGRHARRPRRRPRGHRDDRARRGLPGGGDGGAVERGGHARDVEGGPALRAADVRRRAPGAAGRLGPRAGAQPALGAALSRPPSARWPRRLLAGRGATRCRRQPRSALLHSGG